MKPKLKIKCGIDILMTFALLFLMGYQFWGEQAHEWAGAGIFILFILHHVLNGQWHKALFHGRYTPVRVFQTIVNVLVFVSMLALMYSGIVMSRYVFDVLPISGGMALARRLHILGSYWGFLLMSVHMGLHWNMFISMAKKWLKVKQISKLRSALLFAAGLVIFLYGLSVFIRRDFLTYLFLKIEFVFLDYSESILLFYVDYLALMGLCIFISHYLSRLLRKVCGRKEVSR